MTLRVLTYNIWFSDFITKERLGSLKHAIDELDPHIICLQEVRCKIFYDIVNILPGYTVYPSEIKQQYDCMICVKNNSGINVCSYDCIKYEHSVMMRNLHIVTINYNNKIIIIGNTHFESIFDPADEKIKIKYTQYQHAKNILERIFKTNTEEVILCCDSNLTEEGVHIFNDIFSEWSDTWINNDYGYTYDTSTNKYLQRIQKFIQFRLDRILKHGTGTKVIRSHIVNKVNNKLKYEPSDHYGVFTELSISD